jgi:hypothetical protein
MVARMENSGSLTVEIHDQSQQKEHNIYGGMHHRETNNPRSLSDVQLRRRAHGQYLIEAFA